MLQCVVQCVAVCCRVCCIVLQCVAECIRKDMFEGANPSEGKVPDTSLLYYYFTNMKSQFKCVTSFRLGGCLANSEI